MLTIQASDIHGLGSSYGIATAGADILPGGTGASTSRWRGRGMGAGSCDSVTAVFIAVNENVTQIVVQAELQ